MKTPENLADLLSAYVDQIEDGQMLGLVEQKFHETGLITPDVHLGEGDLKSGLKFQLQKKRETLSTEKAEAGMTAVGRELSGLYRQHRKRTDGLFWGIVAFVLLTVVLLLAGALLGLSGLPQAGLGTGVISTLILPLYHTENRKLKTAEENLQRIQLFKAQLELLELIPDEAARRAGYQKIIASLAGGDDLRNATVIQNFGTVDKQVNVQDHRGNLNT